MTKIPKITYQLKKEKSNESSTIKKNPITQELEDFAFNQVDPLSVLSSYYLNHQSADPIDSINEVPQLIEKKEITDAKHYIKMNLHRTITLDETAKKVFLSPYYFSKLFKAETGITFVAYVSQQKMVQATELLRHSDISISQIAKSLGFNQTSYFSRIFKKEYAMTPKEFRSFSKR
ncbi:helix-turn-helix transcriptional regulator [Carnobacterium maltaromaticum]|uniref:helix-turn-helix domain-containing protein n=1 Tax=Carnobacterium maltaromaticum TaxID=2751 RepID=UPI00165BC6DC|nr:AraC family transcriptional regulator [Carnobacterium maltaromaticum]MBC9787593.1 helix-turn-helix domain-containing protein [Carnobacterium maltaromaticum]